ncbi:MAG: hypothetical protein K8M05_18970 [Deltaproteobacteria bacterium]|nr:hypothetical protein [Kofleriaceae bacterium]
MKTTPVVSHVAVFADDGADTFGLDHVVVTCQPGGPVLKASGSCLVPRPEAMRRLAAGGCVIRGDGAPRARIVGDGHTVVVALGHFEGGNGSVSCTVEVNVMRRLRARLVGRDAYPRDARFSGVLDDNFIDPTQVAPGVDLHAEAIAELMRVIASASHWCVAALAQVFGLTIDAQHVRVSLKSVELTWDAHCKHARAAPTLWFPHWRDSFLGAGTGPGPIAVESPRVRRNEMLPDAEVRAMTGSCVLTAQFSKDERHKLYVKHDRLLRYESTYRAARTREILGRPVRLDAIENLADDLEVLGARAYPLLMAAQSALLDERWLASDEILLAFMKAGRNPEKVVAIYRAFLVGDKFHNRGEGWSRELGRLRRMGFAKYVGHGFWAPTGQLRRTLRLVFHVWHHAEEPAAGGGA